MDFLDFFKPGVNVVSTHCFTDGLRLRGCKTKLTDALLSDGRKIYCFVIEVITFSEKVVFVNIRCLQNWLKPLFIPNCTAG